MLLSIRCWVLITAFFSVTTVNAQQKTEVYIDVAITYQTMQNFGASDAWSGQFVGSWPDAKRNAVADWLFSMDSLSNGNPKGIGLSLWRYNLGAGSAEQGDKSGIRDEWRRAALTLGDAGVVSKKVVAQNWFLSAAKKRGVQKFLGFFNSPPVQFTINGKAFANKGQANIDSSNYKAFADYTVKAIRAINQSTGVTMDYISPVNEPQWDWSDGGQEGCPYSNSAISSLVKAFNNSFQKNNIKAKLLVTESGDLKYLLPANDRKDKDDQVHDLFNAASPNYIGGLSNVIPVIAAHSYFTTSPFAAGMALRKKIKDSVAAIKGLAYWQSEYCILGDNGGEINGNKKDLGITAALYLAKVIHEDLAGANAVAWQWWTAISAYDYKDGLIYIDKSETGGNYSDSKMLWALGNFSRFVRPGMQRVKVTTEQSNLLVSGFHDSLTGRLVLIFINESSEERPLAFNNNGGLSNKKITTYTTDAMGNLAKHHTTNNDVIVAAKSIVTIVVD